MERAARLPFQLIHHMRKLLRQFVGFFFWEAYNYLFCRRGIERAPIDRNFCSLIISISISFNVCGIVTFFCFTLGEQRSEMNQWESGSPRVSSLSLSAWQRCFQRHFAISFSTRASPGSKRTHTCSHMPSVFSQAMCHERITCVCLRLKRLSRLLSLVCVRNITRIQLAYS